MKKIVPWILVAAFAAWVLSALHQPPETGFHTRDFGRLPVLLNGRVQPLDSVARNTLLQIRERQSARRPELPTAWLMETMMNPDAADKLDVFRIDNLELLNLLQVAGDRKSIIPSAKSNRIWTTFPGRRNASTIPMTPIAPRSNAQLLKLDNALEIYQRLKLSLCPPGTTDFAGQLAAYRTGHPRRRGRGPGARSGQKVRPGGVQPAARFSFQL